MADIAPIDTLNNASLGSCYGHDINLFFPRDRETTEACISRMRPVAQTHCRDCAIRDPCRAAGARAGTGLWGGILYLKNQNRRPPFAIDLLETTGGA